MDQRSQALDATPKEGATSEPEPKAKVTIEMPAALRRAFDSRAGTYGIATVVIITKALEWYVNRHRSGDLPPNLIDVDRLPDIPTSYPRTMTFKVPQWVVDELDQIQTSQTRSELIREALATYLSAAAAKWDGRFAESITPNARAEQPLTNPTPEQALLH